MNERIKELAEQNRLIHKYMSVSERNDVLEKFEKFAKLIVLDVLDKVGQRWSEGDIKEHFGVEE